MPRKQVSDEIKQEILRKHLDEGRTVKVFAMSISLLTVLSLKKAAAFFAKEIG